MLLKEKGNIPKLSFGDKFGQENYAEMLRFNIIFNFYDSFAVFELECS